MKYAHYDTTTRQILGWYDSGIHKAIQTPNVEVEDTVWQNAIDNNHNKINQDGSTCLADFRTENEIVEANKQVILSQIAELEASQARPLRELEIARQLGEVNEYAKEKVISINAQIEELRKQLS